MEHFYVFLVLLASLSVAACSQLDLLAVSVATDETDGYKRFVRSLKQFNYKYEIYGLGEEWRGGNVLELPGGGQKLNILVRELEKYKNDENKVILFTDRYQTWAILLS
jgi:hypothetical protein